MHSMNFDKPSSDRVAQALEIYGSIAACNDYLTRSNDVHALTAVLMLPCYRAQFERLALQLTRAEENELMSVLRQIANSELAGQERASGAI